MNLNVSINISNKSVNKARFTCDRVQTLFSNVVVLVHPFSIALEVYLRGRRSLAGELDWSVFHNEGVLRFTLEFRQRFGRSGRKGVRKNLAVIAAIYTRGKRERGINMCMCLFTRLSLYTVSVTANEFGLEGNGKTIGLHASVC